MNYQHKLVVSPPPPSLPVPPPPSLPVVGQHQLVHHGARQLHSAPHRAGLDGAGTVETTSPSTLTLSHMTYRKEVQFSESLNTYNFREGQKL